MKAGACSAEFASAMAMEPFTCNDPSHDHFWHPENWPGAKAPARVDYKDTGAVSASLWVLDSAGIGDLWWRSSFVVAHDVTRSATDRRRDQIREAERMAGQLEVERNDYYAERQELLDVQLQGMAFPG